jgi:hypothetical protein
VAPEPEWDDEEPRHRMTNKAVVIVIISLTVIVLGIMLIIDGRSP